MFLSFGISITDLLEEQMFSDFSIPYPAQTPAGKIFYSLDQSANRMDCMQLPSLLCNRNIFQVGDMGEMNRIPPSFCC